jgi:transposase
MARFIYQIFFGLWMGGKSSKQDDEFEEVIAECSICGKKMKFVKRKGASTEDLVCQACGKWETEGMDE